MHLDFYKIRFVIIALVFIWGIDSGSVFGGQQRNVVGTVRDGSGQPLIGVDVSEKNTLNQTSTDDNGRYSISTTGQNPVLVFNYLGFESIEISVSSENHDVVLQESAFALNDVVIVGYGTQKKENLTGSVSAVEGEELAKRPVMRASAALQGLAPGVTVTQRSGEPGSDGGTIRIRGIGTLGNSNPLVLVDGVEENIDGVDPNDIENISILKDAASASIYGSRAANGVVLITTKKAKANKLSIDYKNYFGWQEFTELPEYADGYTYMSKLNEAYENMGRTPLYSEEYLAEYQDNYLTNPDQYPNVDWQDEVFTGSGALQNHYLSISGGQMVKIYSSFGYQDQKGILPGFQSKRYSLRLNANMDVLDNLQAAVMLNGRHSPLHSPADAGAILQGVNRTPPIFASQFSDGRYGAGMNGSNPLAQSITGGSGLNTYDSFRSTFQVNYQPIDVLDFELSYTPDFSWSNGKRFTQAIDTYDFDGTSPAFTVPVRSTLNQSSNRSLTNTLRLLGRFEKRFDDHDVKLLAGGEQIAYNYQSLNAGREDYPFPEYQQLDAGSIEYMTNSGSATEWSLRSFFSRLNYSYKDKYLVEANVRVDGSSRFYTGYKWGTFPSFSVGWRLSQESFLENASWLNELKLRASWGQLGNQLIGDYPFASVINLGQSYNYGGGPVDGGTQLNMANELISWEATTSSNIGLDMSVLDNKLGFSFDYYKRLTSEILLQLPIPALIGQNEPYQNAGEVKNTGWDLSVFYNQSAKPFKYRLGLNLSDVKNEIVDLRGAGPIISAYTFNQEGYPINTLFGYQALGLFQTEEEVENSPEQIGIYGPGDIKYLDVDGDGKIGPEDRKPIGNTIPRYTFGFNFFGEYKGFDLSFLIQGIFDTDVMLERDAAWAFYNAGKIKTWQLDAWTPENTDAAYPRLIAERTHNNFERSSYWVYDASYIRLKNLQLGYTFPQQLISRTPFSKIRIYATGDNLFTKHDMPQGWDPERPNGDVGAYPIAKTFTFGLNITL